MAVTEAQKARVRLYTGHGRGADLHPRLESRWTWLSADEETLLAAILAQIDAIDVKLQSAALTNLDLAQAEDVTFLGPEQLAALRAQGRSLIGRLCILFEVDPLRDYFDTGSGSSGGGLIPLG